MKITILRSTENRLRYRFIADPLEAGGHEVKIVKAAGTLSYFRTLTKLRGTQSPDAVVIMSAKLRAMVGVVWCRCIGLPTLVRVGGNPLRDANEEFAATSWFNPKTKLIRGINKFAVIITLKLARDVIAVNRIIAKELRASMSSNARLHVIPQYCEGPPIKRDHLLPEVPVLLTVSNLGYLAKANGVYWLAKTLADFSRESGCKLRLRIAADGKWREMLRRKIGTLSGSSGLRIDLLGFVADINAEYEGADLLVYHSEHDALPNVLLEAKRASLPILVNDYAPFLDVVNPEISGLIYHDEADFKAAVKRLLEDQSLRERFASAGRDEHANTFTQEASLIRLEAALAAATGKLCERRVGLHSDKARTEIEIFADPSRGTTK